MAHDQPKCEDCGKFISWALARVVRVGKYDMQGEPYEDDEIWGLCENCMSSQETPLAVQ